MQAIRCGPIGLSIQACSISCKCHSYCGVVRRSDFAAEYGGGPLHVDVGAIRSRVEEFDAIQPLQGQASIFQLSVRKSRAETHAGDEEVMIPSQIGGLLDARDALVRACLHNSLGFGEFLRNVVDVE